MYLEHFGLEQPPFRITPDTRVFYEGGDRGAVLEALAWAVENGEGIVKVVGEVGSGKTVLCRMLAQKLPDHVDLVYLVDPGLGPDDVVPAVAFELGLDIRAEERLAQQHRLHEELVARHARGRQVVVFIEEAQNMPLATLESLRLLSNLETDDAKLLQIVLFGQPELDRNLDANEIRQLRERITHSFDLQPLGRQDVTRYLNFRLRAAGYRGPDLFSPRVARALNRHAQGLIRRLNVLADKALLAAYAEGTHTLRPRHVRRAARDVQSPARRVRIGRRRAMLAGAAVILIVAMAWIVLSGQGPGYIETELAIGNTAGGDRQ
ncbi:MAG: AAA family ATPase [Halofilum sp. (in: g-proteobacteria)]|nr:AAA family ATPase [Halofilum sp. (in: g-proteobacteria)]